MSARRYGDYVDSKDPRLGCIPAHWPAVMLKRIATLVYGEALPHERRNDEGAVPVYGSNGAFGMHDEPNTGAPVIFIGRKGSCGALRWSEYPGFAIDTVYFIDRTNSISDLRWLYWALSTLGLEAASQDTGVPGLSREVAYEARLPLPTVAEQRAIAAFLDRETAKIDALVAEQERLIALLAEKRRAVISHAVTKGLDPNAPMKDSGIAWLGEVPAHWEVSQMRRVVSKIEQGWSPLAEGRAAEASEFGVLKLSAVSRGLFWQEENKAFGGELDGDKALEVRGGDLLITRANTPSLVGECCVVPQDVRGSLLLPDLIYRLSLSPTMDARFLCELLRSAIGRHQIQRDARGSSMSMAKIAQEHIKSWVLLKPPLSEQNAIVAHLDRHNGKLDTLITEAERAITLLKERRAALISAAVTGKINVRDAVDTEEVAA